MVHYPIVEILLHLTIPAALLVPIVYAYRIHKDVYGPLVGLWYPFKITMIGIAPLAVLHTIYAIELLSDLTIISFGDIHTIEHLTIIFAFVMIGYSFKLMRDLLKGYGMLMEKIKKGERIK